MRYVIKSLHGLSDTEIVAVIALCGVFFSAAIAYTTSRRSLYINSVTVQRSKWIDSIRNNIAEYAKVALGLSYQISIGQITIPSKDYTERIESLNGLIVLINLQLNPRGTIERNISRIMDKYVNATQFYGIAEIHRTNDLLAAHSQWLLKDEWEKVKFEAAGIVRKTWIWWNGRIRRWRYDQFCRGEGKFD